MFAFRRRIQKAPSRNATTSKPMPENSRYSSPFTTMPRMPSAIVAITSSRKTTTTIWSSVQLTCSAAGQPVRMEVLVGGQIGDLDLEQVIVVAGDVVAIDHFAQLDDRALDRGHVRAGAR